MIKKENPITTLLTDYFNHKSCLSIDPDDCLSAIELIAHQGAVDSLLEVQLRKIIRPEPIKKH